MILTLLAVVLSACASEQSAAQASAAATAQPADVARPAAAPAQSAAAQPTATIAPTPAVAPQAAPAVPADNLTQSAEAGAVTVEITPLNLADLSAATLDFKVAMNTHSVDLGVDLAKLAVLRVSDNEIAAKAWQAPAGGGHHVQGTLSFARVGAAGKSLLNGATSFAVVIRNLAGVPERTFTWNLGTVGAAAGNVPMAASAAVTPTMPMNHGMMDRVAVTSTLPMGSADMAGMMAEMMKMMQGMMGSGTGNMGAGGMESMGGMAGHGAAIPAAGVPEATEKTGGQPLSFKVENGVKVFELTASPVRWNILDNVKVTAWAYNGTVPGPMIRVTEGDKVRIVFKNQLPEATSIHWHGIPVPNAMDGVTPIEPGKSFTYEFTAPPAGTFMYHSHIAADKQVMVGLYAPFIVDPQAPAADKPAVDVTWMLSEWRISPDGQTYPAMPMMGSEPNYFTINGKSFPQTAPITVKKGQRVRVRLANVGQFTHPMHLHGMNFKVVAYDGVSLPPAQQIVRNTVPVNPGELVDIEFVADNVGTWMFHCHVLHHVTNDGVEPGGLVALVQVTE
jgi:hypothetical protein